MVTVLFFETPENPDLMGEILAVFPEGIPVPKKFGPRVKRCTWHQDVNPDTGVVVKGPHGYQVVRRNKPRPNISKEIISYYMQAVKANPAAFNALGPESCPSGVSAIVLTHNRPEWFHEMMESLYRQTRRPDEIIVVANDCEIDLSRYDDRSPKPGLIETRFGRRMGLARNAGAKASRGEYLLFLDDDNYLGEFYIERSLKAIQSARNIAFAWPIYVMVHPDGHRIERKLQEFDPTLLTRANYVDTSAMVRRDAFEEVDGWDDRIRYQDWSLFLRITQRGWRGAFSGARLFYRVHEGQHGETCGVSMEEAYAKIQAEVVRTAIFTSFTGRFDCFDEVFDGIAAIMERHPRLTFYPRDNSNDPKFRDLLCHRLSDAGLWPRVRMLEDKHEPIKIVPQRGGSAVGKICSRMWNQVLTEITEELVLSIEHDIVPPVELLDYLYPLLDQETAVVGAIYRRSHLIGCYQVMDAAGRLIPRSGPQEQGKPWDVYELDMIGHGCCLVRRDWVRDMGIVMQRINNVAGVWPGGDCVMAAQLKEHGAKTKGLLLPEDLRPRHHHNGAWQW